MREMLRPRHRVRWSHRAAQRSPAPQALGPVSVAREGSVAQLSIGSLRSDTWRKRRIVGGQGRVWGRDPRCGFLAPDRGSRPRRSRQSKSEGPERPGRSLSSGSRAPTQRWGERGCGDRARTSGSGRLDSAPGAAACSSSRSARWSMLASEQAVIVAQEGARRAPSHSAPRVTYARDEDRRRSKHSGSGAAERVE